MNLVAAKRDTGKLPASKRLALRNIEARLI
jgi:hypothetical protein